MNQTHARLTVYFEDPFWVGVFERESGGKLTAAKVVFGAEPKDYEVWDSFLKGWHRLRMSPAIEGGAIAEKRRNPKRRQREIAGQLLSHGVGTKAQQAIKKLQETSQLQHKQARRERRRQEKEEQFLCRRHKQKEKHRGH